MSRIAFMLVSVLCLLTISLAANAENTSDAVPTELREAMSDFSSSTLVGGKGPEVYAMYLAEDYSRWTLGNDTVIAKTQWVAGVRGWYDDGWRVMERKREDMEFTLLEDLAFARSIVQETYVGPEGDETVSTAALAEVWVKRDGRWLLFRVDATVINN